MVSPGASSATSIISKVSSSIFSALATYFSRATPSASVIKFLRAGMDVRSESARLHAAPMRCGRRARIFSFSRKSSLSGLANIHLRSARQNGVMSGCTLGSR